MPWTEVETGQATPTNVAPLPLASGGSGADLSATGGTHQFLKQSSVGANVTVGAIGSGDVPDAALTSNVPLKNAANTFSGGDQTISTGNLVLSSGTGGVKERNRSVAMGEWAAWTPTIGSTGGGTVSGGSITTARYSLVGKIVYMSFQMSNFSVSGTVTSITVSLPPGLTCNAVTSQSFPYSDNATNGTGLAQIGAGAASISLFKNFSGTAWAASTSNSIIAFAFPVEVQ